MAGLFHIYRHQLKKRFGARFLDQSALLKNSRGAPLFELLFFVGNFGGIRPAKRIATHLLKEI